MSGEAHQELLNVYDEAGRVVDARPRRAAKASGQPVGVVNVLVANADRQVLLQRRPPGLENGGRWDKTVGGHVGAGESFDAAACREAGEELFDDPASPRVRLVEVAAVAQADRPALADAVLLHHAGVQLNLRDVRVAPDGRLRNVVYHVAVYLGRTTLPIEAFRPQPSEIAGLAWFPVEAVDRMLVAGELAPNMACLWLSRGWQLLALAGVPPRGRLAS